MRPDEVWDPGDEPRRLGDLLPQVLEQMETAADQVIDVAEIGRELCLCSWPLDRWGVCLRCDEEQ